MDKFDWKYALSLELDDAGFDSSVLCEFRARLLCGEAEARLFETLLTRFRGRGLVKARGRQRTDSTHVLAAIRALNRFELETFELVTESFRHALDVLALAAPASQDRRPDPLGKDGGGGWECAAERCL